MTVRFADATLPALTHICRHLRAEDAAEIYPLHWHDDPDLLAQETAALPTALKHVLLLDGEPVAVAGAVPLWPDVWNLFAFGTDKWDNGAIALTRYLRRFLIPAVYHSGAIRGQCWSGASHKSAHDWLTRNLGARHEATVANYGKNGETFFLFAWSRQDAERIIQKCAVAAPRK